MKIGVLGTGSVGHAIATRLVELGHDVTMGARDARNPTAAGWAATHGGRAGDFAAAARDAELVVNATAGNHSTEALAQAAPADGTIVLDVSNAGHARAHRGPGRADPGAGRAGVPVRRGGDGPGGHDL